MVGENRIVPEAHPLYVHIQVLVEAAQRLIDSHSYDDSRGYEDPYIVHVECNCCDCTNARSVIRKAQHACSQAKLKATTLQPVPAKITAGPITVGGSRVVPEVPTRKCPDCGGMRGVQVLTSIEATNEVLSQWAPCIRCGGTGRVVAT